MTFTPTSFLMLSADIAIGAFSFAFLIVLFRLYKGPTLTDRVVALDVLSGLAIGFIAIVAIRTGEFLYVDLALALGLVGFLATVAFARYILVRGHLEARENSEEKV